MFWSGVLSLFRGCQRFGEILQNWGVFDAEEAAKNEQKREEKREEKRKEKHEEKREGKRKEKREASLINGVVQNSTGGKVREIL